MGFVGGGGFAKEKPIEEGYRHAEEKAKVIAVVWGTDSVHCRANYFAPGGDLKERAEFILFFKSFWFNSAFSSNCPGAK